MLFTVASVVSRSQDTFLEILFLVAEESSATELVVITLHDMAAVDGLNRNLDREMYQRHQLLPNNSQDPKMEVATLPCSFRTVHNLAKGG